MEKEKVCLDCYREKLKLGQNVIPVCSEALIVGISGIISNMEYLEQYNTWVIDISDEEGNVLQKGVNASYYTTPERFSERENENCIYSLCFYNEHGNYRSRLPLTKSTNLDYEFPKDISYITLEEQTKVSIEKNCNLFFSLTIGLFVLNEKVDVYFDKKNQTYYIKIKNIKEQTLPSFDLECSIKKFDSFDNMTEYMRSIIAYFNNLENNSTNNIKVSYIKSNPQIQYRKKLQRLRKKFHNDNFQR